MPRKTPEKPVGWLDIEANRDKLKMAGKTIAAVVAAVWVIFLFLREGPKPPNPPKPPEPTLAKSFKICRGEDSSRCGVVDEFVGCGDPDEAAAKYCDKWSKKVIASSSGGHCGFNVYEYTCSQQLPK